MSKVEWAADRLRHKSAEQRGIPARELLPWPRLKSSEQRQWVELVEAVSEALR